jgi:hypothetical protein
VLSAFGNEQSDIHFVFNTVLSWGESSVGDWTLVVQDEADRDAGTLKSWTLNLVGQPATADDRHVFTDEFGEMVAREPRRATLTDLDGEDTLNAAALSSDSLIDLATGGTSRIDGQALAWGTGTRIEHAWGGDGRDQLLGNEAANRLHGQRGDDRLQGRGAADLLDGGAGIDTAVYALPRADYLLQRQGEGWAVRALQGDEGQDGLQAIERLSFADQGLALDLAPGGHAADVAQILRGVFGEAALANRTYAGIGLALRDQGMAYAELVALAVATPTFEQLAGSRSNRDFVQLVYRNVIGRAPDAATLAEISGWLDQGTYTQASLALLACQLDVNRASAALTGLADTGLAFELPPG